MDADCEAIEKAYEDSKINACPTAPIAPNVTCFTEAAFNLDNSTCGNIWRDYNAYCLAPAPASCSIMETCSEVNANYIAHIVTTGIDEVDENNPCNLTASVVPT